ncbi:MAG TPA: sugar nucleotide-binding protein [Rhodanobacteraceae bacterium]|nr:sugar nucleotide-binding protein [Rhodanobacteraceae bacterium]
MADKKKIYIAGCGGMLGEAFHRIYSDAYELQCSDIDVNTGWLEHLDFRDRKAYEKAVVAFNPDCLFHLGAYTDLEYCEQHPDETYATNTLPVEDAVRIANKLDIPILYIGTAGIFDGTKDMYDDWDSPNPLGVYARSKYMGERFVVKNARRYLVCRAGWMMGGGPGKDKKFIQKIMAQIKAGATELFVVDDKLGTPTYTVDFARNVRLLLEEQVWGLYNMVCAGLTSRLEVATELVRLLGRSEVIKITAVGSDYFSKEYFAARPPSERLVDRKLKLRGLNIMRDWRVCLREYVSDYYAGYLEG